jgi:hypothetical protein
MKFRFLFATQISKRIVSKFRSSSLSHVRKCAVLSQQAAFLCFTSLAQGAKLRKTTKSDIAVHLLQAGKYIMV